YFHGFKSSSESSKAQEFKNFVSKYTKNTKIIIPDLDDNFEKAHLQIEKLISDNGPEIVFMGSSLGGYLALYYSQIHEVEAVLINPAIPPLSGFEIHLGENENYATGKKFMIKKDDLSFIRSLHHKKINKPENILVLLESEDEVLNYIETTSYFKTSHIDIIYGGNHSYTSLKNKYTKVTNFLKIT
ncbi:esterase, partial [Gammaproteobacteria bacterium]|nr:esterase [Gammaproteobacteria bacterium]